MSDVWGRRLQEATFAGIPLDITGLSDSMDRALVVHTEPGRDGGKLQDMGLDPRRTSGTLIFYERRGDPSNPIDKLDHLDRLAAFLDAHRSGSAEFVHPVFGGYTAVVARCKLTFDPGIRDAVMLDVEFIEDTETPVTLSRSSDPIGPGKALVAATASEYESASNAIGQSGGNLASEAVEAVEAWERDPDIPSVEITTDLDLLSGMIADEHQRLESLPGLAAIPSLRAISLLHDAVRLAADAARSRRPALVEETVSNLAPLRSVIANGDGDRSEDAYALTIRLNRIFDPLLVDQATIVRPSTNRPGLRSSTR